MKQKVKFPIFVLFLATLSSCYTMYSSKTLDIEIAIPGNAYFPEPYKNLAIRFNNINSSYNPVHAKYYLGEVEMTDKKNLDSIAAYVYYSTFLNELNNRLLFDSIIEIEEGNYSKIEWIDTITSDYDVENDSVDDQILAQYLTNKNLATYINSHKKDNTNTKKYLNPELGLYSKSDLVNIKDTTIADVLLSLDIFETTDVTKLNEKGDILEKSVFILGYWNFYDLHSGRLKYFYDRIDTISWKNPIYDYSAPLRKMPPRYEAVMNAADITGSKYAKFLVPHWMEVERMYYISGQVDLKKAEKLLQNNEWMEAAKLWKKNVDNKNKFIAAKSMYNLALANEIQGNFDAAVDWVVKSYLLLGNKHVPHPENCRNYIDMLTLRKYDVAKINSQIYGKKQD